MNQRIHSIDIFRGLTMLLMIWVNDFWRLTGVPDWLQHMPADVDALGFSDIIFPAFLFITGLSIPFALKNRRNKGESTRQIFIHILGRSTALVVMGFFMVNLESYDSSAALLPQALWQVLLIIAFGLIWNAYPKPWREGIISIFLTGAGWVLLGGLAAVFRSGSDIGYNWMEPHWWGILGLIGWAYLIAATIMLFGGNSLAASLVGWFALTTFHLMNSADLLGFLSPVRNYIWISSDGALPSVTLAGCIAGSLLCQPIAQQRQVLAPAAIAILGLAFLAAGFVFRMHWGISKIYATPSWTFLCSGISFLSFALLHWVADLAGKRDWAKFLEPASKATLTCYLVPYLAYPAMKWLSIELPAALQYGLVGLVFSMLFTLAIVFITGLLNRVGIKLRI